MSNPFGPNLLATTDNLPLGYIVTSPINLELASASNPVGKGKWMAVDGKDRYRGEVDYAISSQFAAGVFASTSRTLAAAPAAASMDASPTYFVASAVAGVLAGQYSTDAATWSQTALVSPALCQVNSVLWNGIRWVFGCSGSAHVCVTTGDNPNSIWTECTGDTTTTLAQGLAYSSSLAMTLMVPNGTGTSVYTLPDGSTTFTARTTTSSSKFAVCWTGTKFMILTGNVATPIQTSTNGTSWTDAFVAGFNSASGLSIASDGQGTIVIAFANYFLVSNDDGTNWRKIHPPMEFFLATSEVATTATLTLAKVVYSNSKFFAFLNGGNSVRVAVSSKGITWAVEPIATRGVAQLATSAIAFKAGVYSSILLSSTAALSATEDMGRFRMPAMARQAGQSGAGTNGNSDYQQYMKVAP